MTTKKLISFICGLLIISIFSGHKNLTTEYKGFEISYTSVGLGSNFTSMQPVFYVKDLKFVYTSEQTSYYKNQKINKPETLQVGKFRKSSVDSIVSLIKDIKDSLIYRTNTHVSSGGIHYITVKTSTQKLQFDLHNASDPVAEKIVSILNKYITNPDKKLWLFDDK